MNDALAAARRGSEESFRTLYRAVHPSLLRYLATLVGQDAEDVASEAWLQIARDLDRFTGDFDGFKAWTATIARHRAMDHLRRMRRRPSDPVPVEDLLEVAAREDTAAIAVDGISTRTALALISRLPRDQADAILLRVVLGLDARSAGQVLGKRPGAVRTAAHRGLQRLATSLGESGHPAVPGRTRGGRRGVTSSGAAALNEAR